MALPTPHSDPREFAAEDTDVLERALREGRVCVAASEADRPSKARFPQPGFAHFVNGD